MTRTARTILHDTSNGLHGIADGCQRHDLKPVMQQRAEEFDAAMADLEELMAAGQFLATNPLGRTPGAVARWERAYAKCWGTP